MKKIAVFASGAGSNTQKIIDSTSPSQPELRSQPSLRSVAPKGMEEPSPNVRVALIVCNNPKAGVLKIAGTNNIPSLLLERAKFFSGNAYTDELKEQGIDFIVLAGFLWKIPTALINAFPQRIINIHPALLPKYGGKGMYGKHVHQAVIDNNEKESGITIHYVDEIYDHGKIIFQATCPVLPDDTAESLAQRVHALEHEYYPTVIEELLK